MDFGRLPAVDGIDFVLPANHPRDIGSSPQTQRAANPRVLCGAPIWSAKGFLGKIYPESCRAKDYLREYAQQFETIELNATFYRSEAAQIRSWAGETPESFEFCAKLPKRITHELRLESPVVDREAEAFAEALEGLGPRRGPAWLLAPPHFGPDEMATLARFLATWARRLRLCVELREPQWFSDVDMCNRVVELFREHAVPWIVTDTAGRRDVLHMCRTTPEAFVRFTGNDLHPSDFARLDTWARRAARWFDTGTHTLRFFLHQQQEDLVVELAEHFATALEREAGITFEPPQRTNSSRPEQGSLFG